MIALLRNAILLCLALAILLIAYLGPSAYRIEQMDKEVDRLCARDGGIHIYERVMLSPALFNKWGDPSIQFSNVSQTTVAQYALEIKVTEMGDRDSFGATRASISKFQAKAIRNQDGKILGEVIGYTRLGGDPIGPWHPSSYSGCAQGGDKELKKKVFIKGG